MTDDETIFWELVHDYALRKFDYSVCGLHLEDGAIIYTLRLKKLGAPDSATKIFPIFVDQLRNCVVTSQLPNSLMSDFDVQLK